VPHLQLWRPGLLHGRALPCCTLCQYLPCPLAFPGRPEVCRTYNFGDLGSSSGQYHRLFLKPIALNREDVDWVGRDLSFLEAGRWVGSWRVGAYCNVCQNGAAGPACCAPSGRQVEHAEKHWAVGGVWASCLACRAAHLGAVLNLSPPALCCMLRCAVLCCAMHRVCCRYQRMVEAELAAALEVSTIGGWRLPVMHAAHTGPAA